MSIERSWAPAAVTFVGALVSPFIAVAGALTFFATVDLVLAFWVLWRAGEFRARGPRVAVRFLKDAAVYSAALVIAHVAGVYIFKTLPLVDAVAGLVAMKFFVTIDISFERLAGFSPLARMRMLIRPGNEAADEEREHLRTPRPGSLSAFKFDREEKKEDVAE